MVDDDYSCKVTLDIHSIGNKDSEKLMNILKNYIKRTGRLKDTVVSEDIIYKLSTGKNSF
jgi:hypothetical protein